MTCREKCKTKVSIFINKMTLRKTITTLAHCLFVSLCVTNSTLSKSLYVTNATLSKLLCVLNATLSKCPFVSQMRHFICVTNATLNLCHFVSQM